MANNKIQLSDGTVLLDLSNDTVTDASHIMSGRVGHLANGLQVTGTGVSSSSVQIDMEWMEVYSDWQAGYYYDPDNDYAYTQIPSTETTWEETQTYLSTSCTPYTNMIAVKSGEKYRYQNMPIHFDSKNAEVPSVLIFDSNKDLVQSYTRTYQDEWTEFTIPADGVWMAVLYANSQTYHLQKYVAKTHFQDEILNDIEANYRSYLLTVPPTKKTLTKAYICLGTDDLRPFETKNLHTMFTTANVPYYMAAIPENAKACITNDPYKTNLDYMKLCVQAGGEIVCHSADWITQSNKNDFDTMYKYFCQNKQELESYGFNVRGIFKAGGTGAIDTPDPVVDAWANYYYEYGDSFGSSFPYANSRSWLDDWENYSGITAAIQDAITNHGYLIYAWHYYNSNAQLAMDTILNALSGYTRGTDYEFVTPSQLYDLLMPTTRPSGNSGSGTDANTTYTLSRSGNVITLTGSDSSTSSITLPVYNGGVST